MSMGLKIDEIQFKKYRPLVEDVRLDQGHSVTLGSLIISARRCILLLMAMLVFDFQWLQLYIFITLSLVSLAMILIVTPFI